MSIGLMVVSLAAAHNGSHCQSNQFKLGWMLLLPLEAAIPDMTGSPSRKNNMKELYRRDKITSSPRSV